MEMREFVKIKGSICNTHIKPANTCSILPRPTDSKKLILLKLKRDLRLSGHKYWGWVYFEPVRPNVMHEPLNCLKTHKKSYEDISISEGLSSKKMINFLQTSRCCWKYSQN